MQINLWVNLVENLRIGWFGSLFAGWDSSSAVIVLAITISMILLIPIIKRTIMRISDYLYFDILEDHQEWIKENGLFSSQAKSTELTGKVASLKSALIENIANRNECSTADELSKWGDLLERGLISEEEYKSAKEKVPKPTKFNIMKWNL